MPSVPAVRINIKSRALLEGVQKGYVFSKDRWEGEENKVEAQIAAATLKSVHKYVETGVFSATDSDWKGVKKVEYPYYKIWIRHPEDPLYYTWWTPTKETWHDPLNAERVTWFEFLQSKDG